MAKPKRTTPDRFALLRRADDLIESANSTRKPIRLNLEQFKLALDELFVTLAQLEHICAQLKEAE